MNKSPLIKLISVATLTFATTLSPAALAFDIGNTTINTSTTPAITSGSPIVFTDTSGSGTLNIDGTISLGAISTNSTLSSGGTISLTSAGDNSNIGGNVGSSSKAIKSFIITSAAASSDPSITFQGDVYIANGITVSVDNLGTINFFELTGTTDTVISSSVGSSSNKVSVVNVDSGVVATNKFKFLKDINTHLFKVNNGGYAEITRSATDASNPSVNLGALSYSGNTLATTVDLKTDASATSVSSNANSVLKIANNKGLTVSGASTLNGTLEFSGSFDTGASIISNGAVTVADGTKINFDYSNATDLRVGNHTFLTGNTITIGGAAVSSSSVNSLVISDTSLLLDSSLASSTSTSLILTTSLNTSVVSVLRGDEQSTLNSVVNGSLGSAIRTELLKINDLTTLKTNLDTLEQERNNMVPITSMDISNKIQNVINYRTMALNYNYIGFSSGNKKKPKGSMWGEVFGGFATQDMRDGEEGYDSNIRGLVFGVDNVTRTKNRDYTFGLAASYSKANIEGKSLAKQNTDINAYQATLYNNIVANNGMGLFSENALSLGYNQYKSSRSIIVGAINQSAASDYYGLQYSARTGVGYNVNVGNKLLVAPNISLKYSVLDLQNYKEKSSGNYALNVKNDRFTTLSTDTGVRIMGQIDTGKSSYNLFPQLNLSWTRNISVQGRDINSSFIGTNVQSADKSIPVIKDIFNAGIQLNIEDNDAASFILKYELQGAKNYLGHFGSVRYRVLF